MPPMKATFAKVLLVSATLLGGGTTVVRAQTLPQGLPGPTDIPSSILLSHNSDVDRLTQLTHRAGALGAAAEKALDLLKRHHKREVDYILPPLTLIPALAAGKFSPEMRWAIEMSDRVKANREEIFQEHVAITEVMTALRIEAEKVDDRDAAEFAEDAVADSVADMEIQEPTSVLVGEILRARFAAAK